MFSTTAKVERANSEKSVKKVEREKKIVRKVVSGNILRKQSERKQRQKIERQSDMKVMKESKERNLQEKQ